MTIEKKGKKGKHEKMIYILYNKKKKNICIYKYYKEDNFGYTRFSLKLSLIINFK